MLLGLGYTPYELMLQLLTKADDPFSGGRSYYAHPANTNPDKPTIIHQSSATGMQAIPTTGIAQGIQYWECLPEPQPPLTLPKGENNAQPSLDEDAKNNLGFSSREAGAMVASPFGGGREGAIVVCSLGDASITEGEVRAVSSLVSSAFVAA